MALLPLAALFGGATALQRWAHRAGLRSSTALPVPVVVVGNLIVGGAGKTPTVIAVVDLLRRNGFTPGIVSRGYGRADDRAVVDVALDAKASNVGDEPLLLRRRTGAPVCVGRDRVAVGRELLRRHPAVDVIVGDDGLQHHRLARDVQVLVFDERGAGNGWLLPAGPLRERLPQRLPPATVVLYNAAAPSTPLPGSLARRSIGRVVALADWHAGRSDASVTIESFSDRPLIAAAGLARPERFFDMLTAAGARFTPLPLADHHDFSTLPWPPQTADVITTEKDAVKLDPDRMGATRVWVAALDFRPADTFDAALIALLRAALAARATAAAPPRHGNPPS